MAQNHKVIVKHLPVGTTQDSIHRLFEACGNVLEVRITDFSGIDATVAYASHDSASRAVSAFNRNLILGGNVEVTFASGQQVEYKVFAGNLPATTTQEELSALFASYGTILEAVLLPRKASQSDQRCGFIKFGDSQEATAAIQALNGSDWGGSKLAVRMADTTPKASNWANPLQAVLPAVYNAAAAYGLVPQVPWVGAAGGASSGGAVAGAEAKLFVGNIPSYWTKENLAAQFAPYGALEEVVILARKGINNTQCGFVKYANAQSAALAIQSLAGTVIDGAEFVVRWADKNRQGGQVGPARPARPAVPGFAPY